MVAFPVFKMEKKKSYFLWYLLILIIKTNGLKIKLTLINIPYLKFLYYYYHDLLYKK